MAVPSSSNIDDALVEFVVWGLRGCGFEIEEADGQFRVPAVTSSPAANTASPATDSIPVAAPLPLDQFTAASLRQDDTLLLWISERLATQTFVCSPRAQVNGIHELTSQLYGCYQLDGGSIQLAGCNLEDRFFLRLSFRDGSGLSHEFLDWDGSQVEAEQVAALGMDQLCPPTPRRAGIDTEHLESLVEQRLQTRQTEHPGTNEPLLATAVVACKFAVGKLELLFGDELIEIPFSGWATRLRDGSSLPPPYRCSRTGKESYHLTTADDGTVTVMEAIGVCSASGERAVLDRLRTCPVTGELALEEHFQVCPVSGEHVLADGFQECEMCGQSVASLSLEEGVCSACRHLQPIGDDDARRQQWQKIYPCLERWRGWKVSESEQVYLIQVQRWLKVAFIVLNKQDSAVLRIRERPRWSKKWQDVSAEAMGDWLGG